MFVSISIIDMEIQQTPEEQDLVDEKKKNLSILQSVLNINIQPSDTSKGAAKSKIFKYEVLVFWLKWSNHDIYFFIYYITKNMFFSNFSLT